MQCFESLIRCNTSKHEHVRTDRNVHMRARAHTHTKTQRHKDTQSQTHTNWQVYTYTHTTLHGWTHALTAPASAYYPGYLCWRWSLPQCFSWPRGRRSAWLCTSCSSAGQSWQTCSPSSSVSSQQSRHWYHTHHSHTQGEQNTSNMSTHNIQFMSNGATHGKGLTPRTRSERKWIDNPWKLWQWAITKSTIGNTTTMTYHDKNLSCLNPH